MRWFTWRLGRAAFITPDVAELMRDDFGGLVEVLSLPDGEGGPRLAWHRLCGRLYLRPFGPLAVRLRFSPGSAWVGLGFELAHPDDEPVGDGEPDYRPLPAPLWQACVNLVPCVSLHLLWSRPEAARPESPGGTPRHTAEQNGRHSPARSDSPGGA